MVLLHLRKEKQGQKGERNKTIILLRVSTGAKPPQVARGQRNGSDGSCNDLFIFDPDERNKMTEVLLRSAGEAEKAAHAIWNSIKFTISGKYTGRKARAGRAHIS